MKYALIVLLLLAPFQCIGSTSASGDASRKVADAYKAALVNPLDNKTLERLLAVLPKFNTKEFGDMYVIEGDLLFTREQIRNYLVEKSALEKRAGNSRSSKRGAGELLLNVVGGRPDYWQSRSARKLTYWIDSSMFSGNELQTVRDTLARAARDWESACADCGISFVEASQRQGALFTVTQTPRPSGFIAAAFFPSSPPQQRILWIDASFFSTSFDKTGVLRHELGHVLGYRHEHIRGVPGCNFEDSNWVPLTPYDARSVMHYFCGGRGSLELNITPTDVEGHKRVYRTP